MGWESGASVGGVWDVSLAGGSGRGRPTLQGGTSIMLKETYYQWLRTVLSVYYSMHEKAN